MAVIFLVFSKSPPIQLVVKLPVETADTVKLAQILASTGRVSHSTTGACLSTDNPARVPLNAATFSLAVQLWAEIEYLGHSVLPFQRLSQSSYVVLTSLPSKR